MRTDREMGSRRNKTKKLPRIPQKIGKNLKRNIYGKLTLKTKKCMKMRKEILGKISTPSSFSKVKNKSDLTFEKASPNNIEYTPIQRTLWSNALPDEKLTAKAKTALLEFNRKDERDCPRYSCEDVSLEKVCTAPGNEDINENISRPKPSNEILNQNEECSSDEDYASAIEEDRSRTHSNKRNLSEIEDEGKCKLWSSNPKFSARKTPKGDNNEINQAKAEFHHLSGKSYLLILRHPGQIYFRGTMSVKPISGITSFLGYEFLPGMKSHLVFSPKGISPLYFSTTGYSCDIKELPQVPGVDENILKRLGRYDCSLLVEPASGEHWDKLSGFFNRVLKFNPLTPPLKGIGIGRMGMDVENDLRVELVKPSKFFHRESLQWETVSQEIQNFSNHKGQVRVMVYGGKGVGKSTFMRFLVNRWFTACSKTEQNIQGNGAIIFIDFDPGQSEFVPPGCLSATLISEPLLGPNYTHLKDPERMVCVGDIDVSKCPQWYLYCADDIIKFCSSEVYLSKLPWFINTMGFCKGIGADLAEDLIHLCNPTHVVQLTSIWSRRNFEPLNLLSWPSVNSRKTLKWNSVLSSQKETSVPKYFYYQLQSLAERSIEDGAIRNKVDGMEDIDSQWGLPAWQSRELCILAYFSRIVNAPNFSVLKPEPHRFKLSDVVLSLPTDLVKPQYITSVFNGRLAALCCLRDESEGNVCADGKACNTEKVNQKSVNHKNVSKNPWEKFLIPSDASYSKILFHMPLAPCLGFGIIRGVDNCNHEVYVTTPLSNDITTSVNCFATSPTIGSLPESILFNSVKESKKKFIPYVMIEDNRNKFNRRAPRVFQPILTNTSMKR